MWFWTCLGLGPVLDLIASSQSSCLGLSVGGLLKAFVWVSISYRQSPKSILKPADGFQKRPGGELKSLSLISSHTTSGFFFFASLTAKIAILLALCYLYLLSLRGHLLLSLLLIASCTTDVCQHVLRTPLQHESLRPSVAGF